MRVTASRAVGGAGGDKKLTRAGLDPQTMQTRLFGQALVAKSESSAKGCVSGVNSGEYSGALTKRVWEGIGDLPRGKQAASCGRCRLAAEGRKTGIFGQKRCRVVNPQSDRRDVREVP